MNDPKDEHMNALKRIMWYIKGILNYDLHPYKSPFFGITSYAYDDLSVYSNT